MVFGIIELQNAYSKLNHTFTGPKNAYLTTEDIKLGIEFNLFKNINGIANYDGLEIIDTLTGKLAMYKDYKKE